MEERWWEKKYDPFEHDLSNFPDSFNMEKENFQKLEDAKKFFAENPYTYGKTVDKSERIEPTNKDPWTKKY